MQTVALLIGYCHNHQHVRDVGVWWCGCRQCILNILNTVSFPRHQASEEVAWLC